MTVVAGFVIWSFLVLGFWSCWRRTSDFCSFGGAIFGVSLHFVAFRAVQAFTCLALRAFARKGAAYQKKGDLELSIQSYKSSLVEHRVADTLTKLHAVASPSTADDCLHLPCHACTTVTVSRTVALAYSSSSSISIMIFKRMYKRGGATVLVMVCTVSSLYCRGSDAHVHCYLWDSL